MSSHSVTKIDQKEYLKKYLSGDKEKKKKKKDKKHKKSERSVKVRIIDDDINHLDGGLQIDEELLLTGDDAPQIVGEYIEETLADSKIPKWKSFAIKDEPLEDRIASNPQEADLWGRKMEKVKIKQEFSNKSSDISPPRRKDRKRHSPSNSPPRRSRKSASPARRLKKDNSPPRRRQEETPDHSPKRRNKEKPNFDNSPPRKSKNKYSPERNSTRPRKGEDQSPRRNATKSYSSDQSPPRQRKSPNRKRRNSDQSPKRKEKNSPSRNRGRSPDQSPNRRRRNSDHSPPRRAKNSPSRQRKRSPDQSPVRRRRDSDQSPQRKRNFSPSRDRKRSPDQTPPRRRRDSDQSPPRKDKNSPKRDRKKSPPRRRRDSDQSPPRSSRYSPPARIKTETTTRDLSPPRQSKIKRKSSSPSLTAQPPPQRRSRWERRDSEKSISPPPTHKPKATKTLEGKKAGLQDAQSLQKETTERRKQEDLLFEKMSSDISGRNAEIQVRSTGRQGRRAREAKEEDPEERRRKEAHEEKKKQLYERWGKGLKQIEDYKNRLAEQEHESNKPLARYSNDEDLERHLREQERADDPMLEYMRQKRKEKEKQSGKPEVPKYQGSFPENRFGIRPGYRWDGVDRSNGYEKKYFDVQNEKRARQDEAYKYSVEDM